MKKIILLLMLTLMLTQTYAYQDVDYTQYISVNTQSDIEIQRQVLIDWIWQQGRENKEPTSISSKNPSTVARFSTLDVSKINQGFDYYYDEGNFKYHVYHFTNKNPNNRLFIFAQGHGKGDLEGTNELINAFLNEGYDIVIKYMVSRDVNTGQVDHDFMQNLVTPTFNPMELYFNDLWWTLNYLDINYNYDEYVMSGLSGGGWTTVWYSAIDNRINKSFSVAGSYPRYIYDTFGNKGDWEQGPPGTTVHTFLTTEVSYLDFYLLASTNGKHRSIYNEFDDCCFKGTHFEHYRSYITNLSNSLGGDYDNYLTQSNKHVITAGTKDYIISELNNVTTLSNMEIIQEFTYEINLTQSNLPVEMNKQASQSNKLTQGIRFKVLEDINGMNAIKHINDGSNVANLYTADYSLLASCTFVDIKCYIDYNFVNGETYVIYTGNSGTFNRVYYLGENSIYPHTQKKIQFISGVSNKNNINYQAFSVIGLEYEELIAIPIIINETNNSTINTTENVTTPIIPNTTITNVTNTSLLTIEERLDLIENRLSIIETLLQQILDILNI